MKRNFWSSLRRSVATAVAAGALVAGAMLLVLAPGAFAQGLTTTDTAKDWEEVNFEFDSAVLSDG
nr:hypothetical protein [Bryobacterales bacterium]